jgi:hypothetical protein
LEFSFFAPWHGLLPREAGHVIAFAGGSGRRDLMEHCAAVLTQEGVPLVRGTAGEPDPGDGVVLLADTAGDAGGRLPAAGGLGAWPPRTSLAMVETSVAPVGEQLGSVLEPQQLPKGAAPWEPFTWEHLEARLLETVESVPAGTPIVLALTSLEDQADSIGLFGCVGRLMADPRLPLVLFVSVGDEGANVRGCCREAGA